MDTLTETVGTEEQKAIKLGKVKSSSGRKEQGTELGKGGLLGGSGIEIKAGFKVL